MNAGRLKERITLREKKSKISEEGDEKVLWKDIGKVWARIIPLKAENVFQHSLSDDPNNSIKQKFVVIIRKINISFNGVLWRGNHYPLMSVPTLDEGGNFMRFIIIKF